MLFSLWQCPHEDKLKYTFFVSLFRYFNFNQVKTIQINRLTQFVANTPSPPTVTCIHPVVAQHKVMNLFNLSIYLSVCLCVVKEAAK